METETIRILVRVEEIAGSDKLRITYEDHTYRLNAKGDELEHVSITDERVELMSQDDLERIMDVEEAFLEAHPEVALLNLAHAQGIDRDELKRQLDEFVAQAWPQFEKLAKGALGEPNSFDETGDLHEGEVHEGCLKRTIPKQTSH